jgi:hypothetical protein
MADRDRDIPSMDFIAVGDPADDAFVERKGKGIYFPDHGRTDRPRAHIASGWPGRGEHFPVDQDHSRFSACFVKNPEKVKREEGTGGPGADDAYGSTVRQGVSGHVNPFSGEAHGIS